MTGVLIETKYRYDKVTLTSGNIVSASDVSIKDKKVSRISGGTISRSEMENAFFSATLKSDGTYNYSLDNGNSGMDADSIILEFVAFIKKDLSL